MAKLNKQKDVIKTDPDHQMRVKEGQLKNTLVQIAEHQKEIASLKKALGQASGVKVMLSLEEKLRDSREKKVELEKRIKELEMRQKEQAKQLERLSNEEDFQLKLRGLVDELRVWRQKVHKLKEQQEKEEHNKKTQQEMLKQIQIDNEKFRQVINHLRQEKGFAVDEPITSDLVK